jgi:CubicO group peptidase (beta-lactamase class C family)
MNRRTFIAGGMSAVLSTPILVLVRQEKFDAAAGVLREATASGQILSAALCVRHGREEFTRPFGQAKAADARFLLASITKTLTAAAVMTLVDREKLRLEDPVAKTLPEFSAELRGKITLAHLLRHVSGLPDQLPENGELRRSHAPLARFVEAALRTPLLFEPGTRFSYSSMGILLASEMARRVTSTDFPEFLSQAVLQPLEMKHSVLGLGPLRLEDVVRNQTDHAAPESGAGNPSAKDWDWNSPYWRALGAPWGTAHCSAPDVARFLAEFLHPTARMMKPETARLMVRNHNPEGIAPWGLGFAVGTRAGSPGCSERTFGHSGASGTLAWADPATDTVCVVLTTLPGGAAKPHPLRVASDLVAKAVSG